MSNIRLVPETETSLQIAYRRYRQLKEEHHEKLYGRSQEEKEFYFFQLGCVEETAGRITNAGGDNK